MLALVVAVAGCATPSPVPSPTPLPPPAATPTRSAPVATATAPVPTPTPLPPRAWLDPRLPPTLQATLSERVRAAALTPTANTEDVDALRLTIATTLTASIVATEVFALAAPFLTAIDGLSAGEARDMWLGRSPTRTLLLDTDVLAALTPTLGSPGAAPRVRLTERAQLLTATLAAGANAFALLPFDMLDVRWRLMTVGTTNLFERSADLTAYPFVLRVVASGPAAGRLGAPISNRDPARMAVVAMTGVTALVRGTAVQMVAHGETWPGEKIRSWLRDADIAHISNEVSFNEACPAPNWYEGTVFCSQPARLALLKDVGTDVIELTGNHLWDYGWRALSTTLTTYESLGWQTFGGGRTVTESLKPVTMTVNGNRIAFVGCNYFGANWATDVLPGSARCGSKSPYQFDLITPTIRSLSAQGYLVIATVQYAEDYQYAPTPQQVRDFGLLRDAGAIVVNGSQGHHVQGFDVSRRGFIHYGVGNLFFGDQEGAGTHQTFVDRHVFMDGRYLGVDLRAAFIENAAQPVPMTPAAKQALLTLLFRVSGFSP